MQGLFSKRFKKALREKTIPYPSFSRVLRKRLALACREYTEEWITQDGYTSTQAEALEGLQRAYGRETLRVLDKKTNGDRKALNFEDFIVYAYPHEVLDALEAFYRLLSGERQCAFQADLNEILQEEESPWRMSDGRVYMVDSRFLDALKEEVAEQLRREGFLGAYDEFRDARSHLQAGAIDDAINKANRAFESSLKSLLNKREGTADQLLAKLREETDLLSAVPIEAQQAVIARVMQGLPVLRHKLGSHGQGARALHIPRAYGELAVNLAAAYIKFLLDLKRDHSAISDSEDDVDGERFEDDVPF